MSTPSSSPQSRRTCAARPAAPRGRTGPPVEAFRRRQRELRAQEALAASQNETTVSAPLGPPLQVATSSAPPEPVLSGTPIVGEGNGPQGVNHPEPVVLSRDTEAPVAAPPPPAPLVESSLPPRVARARITAPGPLPTFPPDFMSAHPRPDFMSARPRPRPTAPPAAKPPVPDVSRPATVSPTRPPVLAEPMLSLVDYDDSRPTSPSSGRPVIQISTQSRALSEPIPAHLSPAASVRASPVAETRDSPIVVETRDSPIVETRISPVVESRDKRTPPEDESPPRALKRLRMDAVVVPSPPITSSARTSTKSPRRAGQGSRPFPPRLPSFEPPPIATLPARLSTRSSVDELALNSPFPSAVQFTPLKLGAMSSEPRPIVKQVPRRQTHRRGGQVGEATLRHPPPTPLDSSSVERAVSRLAHPEPGFRYPLGACGNCRRILAECVPSAVQPDRCQRCVQLRVTGCDHYLLEGELTGFATSLRLFSTFDSNLINGAARDINMTLSSIETQLASLASTRSLLAQQLVRLHHASLAYVAVPSLPQLIIEQMGDPSIATTLVDAAHVISAYLESFLVLEEAERAAGIFQLPRHLQPLRAVEGAVLPSGPRLLDLRLAATAWRNDVRTRDLDFEDADFARRLRGVAEISRLEHDHLLRRDGQDAGAGPSTGTPIDLSHINTLRDGVINNRAVELQYIPLEPLRNAPRTAPQTSRDKSAGSDPGEAEMEVEEDELDAEEPRDEGRGKGKGKAPAKKMTPRKGKGKGNAK